MSPPLPPTSPYIADPATGGASPVPRVAPPTGRDARPLAAPTGRDARPLAALPPVQGIAATVEQDADLARHPAVLVYHNFVSKQYISDSFVGISGDPSARPSLNGDCEIIDVPEFGVMGVRVWAAVGLNEKIVGWWDAAEPRLAGARARPYQRDYGDGYSHLFVRYLLRIGEDVAAGAGILAGKLPGMT